MERYLSFNFLNFKITNKFLETVVLIAGDGWKIWEILQFGAQIEKFEIQSQ